MSKNYLLVDGNSLGHFQNNGAKLSIGSLPTQAIVGFLRGLRQQIALFQNYQPVVLWDGASWRKLAFPDYKNIREKCETPAEIALQKMKDDFKKQAPYIEKALRFLGVPQVRALNMEADDLAAILTDRYSPQGRVMMFTGDKDWIQLVGPNTTWRNVDQNHPTRKIVNEKTFAERTGVQTPRQFIEVKALCGDQGDSVPGVGGIGEKGAIDFLNEHGSFAQFTNSVLLDKTIDLKKVHKKFRLLIEDETKAMAFHRNIDLVDLRTSARPAPINLVVDKGTPDIGKFQTFCELLLFKSITQELDDWIRVFPAFRDEAARQLPVAEAA